MAVNTFSRTSRRVIWDWGDLDGVDHTIAIRKRADGAGDVYVASITFGKMEDANVYVDGATWPGDGNFDVQQQFLRARNTGEASIQTQMEGRVVVHEGTSRGRGKGGGRGARARTWVPQSWPPRRGSSRGFGAGQGPRARGYVGHAEDGRVAAPDVRGDYAVVVRGSEGLAVWNDDRNTDTPVDMSIVRHEARSAFNAAVADTALRQRQRADDSQTQLARGASELLQLTARHDAAIIDMTANQVVLFRRMAESDACATKAEADAATTRASATEALGVAGHAMEASNGANKQMITVLECIA